METLRKTPLYDKHVALGARMVGFGGWDMPVQYGSIKAEHLAVRTSAGLFDVSHMGQFEVRGSRLIEFLDYLCANDATKLSVGEAQYSMFLNAQGGTIDDIIVYRLGEQYALIVVNAGNIEKDWAHVDQVAQSFDGVTVENLSDTYGLLAIQGPVACALVNELTDIDVSQMGYYSISTGLINNHDVILARTGYTGEDGFEIFIKAEEAAQLWDLILAVGAKYDLEPAGLGARDTLRLEASMPLYGHELNDNTSPLEAGLGYFVAKKGNYIGAERQQALRQRRSERKLVMLELQGRGIAREGYEIFDEADNEIGEVTSGSLTPYLNKAIAMGYVKRKHSRVGTTVQIQIRRRRVPAEVVKRPFYKRSKQ